MAVFHFALTIMKFSLVRVIGRYNIKLQLLDDKGKNEQLLMTAIVFALSRLSETIF